MTIDLQWKSFNVNLSMVKAWVIANISASCTGLSANTVLQVHFSESISDEEKQMLQDYWDGLTDQSDEAQEYQSQADIEAARLAKKASAAAKLEALGLTADEIAAILG